MNCVLVLCLADFIKSVFASKSEENGRVLLWLLLANEKELKSSVFGKNCFRGFCACLACLPRLGREARQSRIRVKSRLICSLS